MWFTCYSGRKRYCLLQMKHIRQICRTFASLGHLFVSTNDLVHLAMYTMSFHICIINLPEYIKHNDYKIQCTYYLTNRSILDCIRCLLICTFIRPWTNSHHSCIHLIVWLFPYIEWNLNSYSRIMHTGPNKIQNTCITLRVKYSSETLSHNGSTSSN